ncbi:hypothetical protein ACIRG4_15400 [Streptomyces sp. NPDC102395]|uniref:hypothetical protein n=1 Tax=Streptomyces sp. NPDC102395 TaxID=3366168 RepID=UPI0038100629
MPTNRRPARRRRWAPPAALTALAAVCGLLTLTHPATAVPRPSLQRLAASDRETLAWADDTYGQATVPAAVAQGADIIAAGDFHSLAVKDGAVTAWGSNLYQQTDVPAALSSGVTEVSGG